MATLMTWQGGIGDIAMVTKKLFKSAPGKLVKEMWIWQLGKMDLDTRQWQLGKITEHLVVHSSH
jgi:hypothetical protein